MIKPPAMKRKEKILIYTLYTTTFWLTGEITQPTHYEYIKYREPRLFSWISLKYYKIN